VDSQIIVAASLSDQAADEPHLLPLVRDVVCNCGKRPSEESADAGYFSEANVTALEQEAISVLIPPGRIRGRTWQREPAGVTQPPRKDAATAEQTRSRLDQPDGREWYRSESVPRSRCTGRSKKGVGYASFSFAV